jgi:hypothetical protein
MMQLRARKGDIEHADWAQQVEIRDRLLELNNEMLGILSEL